MARLELRQEESAPVLAALRNRLLEWKEQLLPKHPMAEAVNYALGQWTELNVFCLDGAVAIDNNVAEREMKRVVLNRKNSLFVGNPSVRPAEREPHLFASDGHCSDGQFRSDLRKPRDYKRDNMQNRIPSLNVSTCMKQKK